MKNFKRFFHKKKLNKDIDYDQKYQTKRIESDFNKSYYLSMNSDVKVAGVDPLHHYLEYGWKEGRDPRPDMENQDFLRKHPYICDGELYSLIANELGGEDTEHTTPSAQPDHEVPANPTQPSSPDIVPLLSYLKTKQEVLDSGLWDERWYLQRYSSEFVKWKSRQAELNTPIDHYLQIGWKARYSPSRTFRFEKACGAESINPISNFLTRERPNYHFDENVWFPTDKVIETYRDQRRQRVSKKVIYCCIIGDYDSLTQPFHIDAEWDYVCFSNDEELVKKGQQGVWEIRMALRPNMGPDRRNRYHKLHPHELFPEYDESLYLDGNVNVISSYLFDEIRQRNLPILLPLHFERNCIYDEIHALLDSPRTSPTNREILPEQQKFLKKMGFPEGYGLTENNVIYRRHHSATIKRIMLRWWDMLCNFSSRDQTGLSYALWKEGISPQDVSIPNTRFIHKDFWIFRHRDKPEVIADRKIAPAFDADCVPIFLSCNDSFVGYLGVVLTSIIENTSDDRNYDIVVLESDISDESKDRINSLTKGNISIRFYNMVSIIEQLKDLEIYVDGYVPAETYNKIFLGQITDGYDKILYIDTDIVVRADIAELYDIELFGKALGASPNIANIHAAYQNTEIRNRKFGDYLTSILGVERFENYFQAGIITMDMTSEKVRNLLQLSLNKLREIQQPIFFDQCIFNSIFYDDVFYFSTTWNHVWYIQKYSYLKYSLRDDLFFDYAKSRLSPKIVHYASGDKPTNKFDWRLSSYFWDYASRSPYANDLLEQLQDRETGARLDGPALSTLRSEPLPRTLVHLHAFYEDQMDYMLEKLDNIEGTNWDLIVTSNDNYDAIEQIIKSRHENSTILRVKNQGFDAFPFLKALQATNLSEYDYVLKLHTKNARPESRDSLVYGLPVPGHKWRDDLIGALLASKTTFVENLKRFENNIDLGCLAAQPYIFSTYENNEQKTYNLRHWMNEFNLETGSRYVGGTMFLARAYPFQRLKGLNPDDLDFAAGDRTSGSHKNLAHVFERLFGLVVENEGLSIESPSPPSGGVDGADKSSS